MKRFLLITALSSTLIFGSAQVFGGNPAPTVEDDVIAPAAPAPGIGGFSAGTLISGGLLGGAVLAGIIIAADDDDDSGSSSTPST